MKAARCPNCGADITVNESIISDVCDFCNTPFNTQHAINLIDEAKTSSQSIMNNYYNTMLSPRQKQTGVKKQSSKIKLITPKPKINIALAIVLFLLLIFPGIMVFASLNFNVLIRVKNYNTFHLL